MLYKRRDQHENICVVRVSPDVLDLPGVVVTNGNASSDYVRFAAAPAGLRIVDEELTFAEFWTHENPVEYYRRKCAKCAEVLVPNRVAPEYIMGSHVSTENARNSLREIDEDIKIKLNPEMFFL
jgi:ssDNA thymidine ADP-ribosyltransferase DarT-like protein